MGDLRHRGPSCSPVPRELSNAAAGHHAAGTQTMLEEMDEGGLSRSILKPLDEREFKVYKTIWERYRNDPIHEVVPTFQGVVEHVTDEGSVGKYVRISNVLHDFWRPTILDIKLGCRTFTEDECGNKKPRPDLYNRMVKMYPDVATEEEHAAKAITKHRWMTVRDRLSTIGTEGYRVDGVAPRNREINDMIKGTADMDIQELFQKFVEAAAQVSGDQECFATPGHIARELQRQIEHLLNIAERSAFVREHEFIGSSVLVVADKFGRVGVWWIDFAKTLTLPEGVEVTHRQQWELGNHEDGIFWGLSNLAKAWEQVAARVTQDDSDNECVSLSKLLGSSSSLSSIALSRDLVEQEALKPKRRRSVDAGAFRDLEGGAKWASGTGRRRERRGEGAGSRNRRGARASSRDAGRCATWAKGDQSPAEKGSPPEDPVDCRFAGSRMLKRAYTTTTNEVVVRATSSTSHPEATPTSSSRLSSGSHPDPGCCCSWGQVLQAMLGRRSSPGGGDPDRLLEGDGFPRRRRKKPGNPDGTASAGLLMSIPSEEPVLYREEVLRRRYPRRKSWPSSQAETMGKTPRIARTSSKDAAVMLESLASFRGVEAGLDRRTRRDRQLSTVYSVVEDSSSSSDGRSDDPRAGSGDDGCGGHRGSEDDCNFPTMSSICSRTTCDESAGSCARRRKAPAKNAGCSFPFLLSFTRDTDQATARDMRTLCADVIKPATSPPQVAYCQSYVEKCAADNVEDTLGQPAVAPATLFVSYASEQRLLDLLEAVGDWVTKEGQGSELGVYLWLDLFSVNQHSTQEQDGEMLSGQLFRLIGKIPKTIVVLDPWYDPVVLRRSWVIWETYATIATGSEIHFAMRPKTRENFSLAMLDSFERVKMAMSQVDVTKSNAYVESDREMIFEEIRRCIGFERMNEILQMKLRQWLIRQVKDRLRDLEEQVVTSWTLPGMVGAAHGHGVSTLEQLPSLGASAMQQRSSLGSATMGAAMGAATMGELPSMGAATMGAATMGELPSFEMGSAEDEDENDLKTAAAVAALELRAAASKRLSSAKFNSVLSVISSVSGVSVEDMPEERRAISKAASDSRVVADATGGLSPTSGKRKSALSFMSMPPPTGGAEDPPTGEESWASTDLKGFLFDVSEARLEVSDTPNIEAAEPEAGLPGAASDLLGTAPSGQGGGPLGALRPPSIQVVPPAEPEGALRLPTIHSPGALGIGNLREALQGALPLPGAAGAVGSLGRPEGALPLPGAAGAVGSLGRPKAVAQGALPLPGAAGAVGSLGRPEGALPLPGAAGAVGSLGRPEAVAQGALPLPGAAGAVGSLGRPEAVAQGALPLPGAAGAVGSLGRPEAVAQGALPVPGSADADGALGWLDALDQAGPDAPVWHETVAEVLPMRPRPNRPKRDRAKFTSCPTSAEASRKIPRLVLNYLRLKGNMAAMLRESGNLEEAERFYRELKAQQESLHGLHHPTTMRLINGLAQTLMGLSRNEEGLAMHRENLQLRQEMLGKKHEDTLQSASNLAIAISRTEPLTDEASREAHELFKLALEGRQAVKGPAHPTTLHTLSEFGRLLSSDPRCEARVEEAEDCHERAVSQLRETAEFRTHSTTLIAMHNQGCHWCQRGAREGRAELFDKGIAQLHEVWSLRAQTLGRFNPHTQETIRALKAHRQPARATHSEADWRQLCLEEFPEMNTASLFLEIRACLRRFGVTRLLLELAEEKFVDMGTGLLTVGERPFNYFARVSAGLELQPGLDEVQRWLGPFQDRYMVAGNHQVCDEKWAQSSPDWVGQASMSKRHRCLLAKDLHWEWFNVLTFGLVSGLERGVARLEEMKQAALHWISRADDWPAEDHVGLFLAVYSHTNCKFCQLHLVDLDHLGPTFHALEPRLLRLDDALSILREEVLAGQPCQDAAD